MLEAKQNESVHIAVTQFVGSVFLINKLYFVPIRVTVSGVRGPGLKPGQVSSGPVSSGLQVQVKAQSWRCLSVVSVCLG